MASAPSRTSSASSFSAPTSSSSAFQQQAIRIACRVRPFLPDELSVMLSPPDEDDIVCSGTSISVLHKAAKHKYRFVPTLPSARSRAQARLLTLAGTSRLSAAQILVGSWTRFDAKRRLRSRRGTYVGLFSFLRPSVGRCAVLPR